jgi:hypothetical protein
MSKCSKTAQSRICDLEQYHEGAHIDPSGFKFIDDRYPDHLGNGPDGYPMNNPAFDRAAAKVLKEREEDAIQAKEFLRKLAQAMKQ